jgi:hypothetical protein
MQFTLVAVLALTAGALAAPTHNDQINICQGGDQYCCNSEFVVPTYQEDNWFGGVVNTLVSNNCSPVNVLSITSVSGGAW